jgi:hypothetical protein
VWHFDGTQWTQTQLDFFPGEASAVSPSDIWTVGRGANGDSRLVAHYNGASWEQVDLGDALAPDISGNPDGGELEQNVFLSDVEALSADDVWVTGHVYRWEAGVSQSSPAAARWNGQVRQQVSVPVGWTPGTIAHDGSGGLWFSGYKNNDQSVLMHRTASGEWSTEAIKSGARTGRIWDFARIPGTRLLWGAAIFGRWTTPPATARFSRTARCRNPGEPDSGPLRLRASVPSPTKREQPQDHGCENLRDLAVVRAWRCGGGWKRSVRPRASGVAQPTGKPAKGRPQALPSNKRHRASPRPYGGPWQENGGQDRRALPTPHRQSMSLCEPA